MGPMVKACKQRGLHPIIKKFVLWCSCPVCELTMDAGVMPFTLLYMEAPPMHDVGGKSTRAR